MSSPPQTRSQRKWYEDTPKGFEPPEWQATVKEVAGMLPGSRKVSFEEEVSRFGEIQKEVEVIRKRKEVIDEPTFSDMERQYWICELYKAFADFTDDAQRKYEKVLKDREEARKYQGATMAEQAIKESLGSSGFNPFSFKTPAEQHQEAERKQRAEREKRRKEEDEMRRQEEIKRSAAVAAGRMVRPEA